MRSINRSSIVAPMSATKRAFASLGSPVEERTPSTSWISADSCAYGSSSEEYATSSPGRSTTSPAPQPLSVAELKSRITAVEEEERCIREDEVSSRALLKEHSKRLTEIKAKHEEAQSQRRSLLMTMRELGNDTVMCQNKVRAVRAKCNSLCNKLRSIEKKRRELKSDLKEAELQELLSAKYQDPVIRRLVEACTADNVPRYLESIMKGYPTRGGIEKFEARLNRITGEVREEEKRRKDSEDVQEETGNEDLGENVRKSDNESSEEIHQPVKRIKLEGAVYTTTKPEAEETDTQSSEENLEGPKNEREEEEEVAALTEADLRKALQVLKTQIEKLQKHFQPVVDNMREGSEEQ